VLKDRVLLDGEWAWVPGDRGDFAKVFRVIPEQGLILFPFSAWSKSEGKQVGGVQLIDLGAGALTLRGLIRDAGWVERGVPRGPTDVLTLGSEVFQAVDITNRDQPRLRSRLELARNSLAFAPITNEYGIELSGDYYSTQAALSVTPLSNPDTPTPAARLPIPATYARMFPSGSFAYLLTQEEVRDNQGTVTTYASRVRVADATDPLQPRLRGSLDLLQGSAAGYGFWYGPWGQEALLVDGSILAIYRSGYGGAPAYVDAATASPTVFSPYEKQSAALQMVDLSDPDAPMLASTVTFDDTAWTSGLRASGKILYLSGYQSVFLRAEGSFVRYELRRIDVSEPANPRLLPAVNIPGTFVDASLDGGILYTLEGWYDENTCREKTFLRVLSLEGDRAVLRSSIELPGYVAGIAVQGASAFAVTREWTYGPPGGVSPAIADRAVTAEPSTMPPWGGGTGSSKLVAIDLTDPDAVRVAGQTEVPANYAHLQKVEAGRAFLASGIGVYSYRVDDLTQPRFEKFFRTQGYSQDISVRGDRAFVPSGYYGVQVLDLSAAP
jgi:hypothetical protein